MTTSVQEPEIQQPDEKPEAAEQKALVVVAPIVARAQAIAISDQSSYEAACGFLKEVKGARLQVKELFADMRDAALKSWRTICEKENKIAEPLQTAEAELKTRIGAYVDDQERLRREQEDQLRDAKRQEHIEEQRRQVEDARLAEASELQAAGKADEAEAVLSAPVAIDENAVYVPPVTVSSTVRPVAGISSRQDWRAEVTDFKLLVKAVADGKVPILALTPNEKFLGEQARSMKSLLNFPGVRAVNRALVAVRTKK